MNKIGSILLKVSTCCFLIAALALYIFTGAAVVKAGSLDRVELSQGHIEPGSITVYTLPDLEKNEKLYVYVQGTSGNLDPFTLLVTGDFDVSPKVTAAGDISQPLIYHGYHI